MMTQSCREVVDEAWDEKEVGQTGFDRKAPVARHKNGAVLLP
jgi:hypothetical protein